MFDFDAHTRSWLIRDVLRSEAGQALADDPIYLRYPLRPQTDCELLEAWPTALERTAPSTSARPVGGSRTRCAVRLLAEDGLTFWIGLELPEGSRVTIGEGLHSPRYGVTLPCPIVTATLQPAPRAETLSVLWSPGDDS